MPHYFLEFDVLDLATGDFLSTAARRERLAGLPVQLVPVLYEGEATSLDDLAGLVGRSLYKSARWCDHLAADVHDRGLDLDTALRETDKSDLMEGLYIKVEEGGRVVERYKWVRAGFLTAVVDSGTHWLRRPIVPNRLRPGVDLFGGES